MADPWDTFKDAEVLEQEPKMEVEPGPITGSPWEHFKDATVLEQAPGDAVTSGVAAEVEKHLSRPKLVFKPQDSDTLGGWFSRFGRAVSLNSTDMVAARIFYQRNREELDKNGIGYRDVLASMREGFDKDRSASAEIVGSLLPAAKVAQVVTVGGKAAAKAMARRGMTEGAMKWGARHPKLARIAQASGVGAGTGAGFEAVQKGVDESIDAMAGEDFDTDVVTSGIVQGAVVGALATPVVDGAMRGVAGLAGWVKNALTGNDEARTAKAVSQMVRAVRNEGEAPDATIERLRNDVAAFQQAHGRMPALAEIVSEEQAKNISKVIGFHAGLEQPAREMGERQIGVALKTLDDAIKQGRPLKDTAVVEGAVEDLFSSVMAQNGKRQVRLPDEAFAALERNKNFLTSAARYNDDARRILDVVESKAKINQFREKATRLRGGMEVASARAEVAELGDEIAEIISSQFAQAKVPPSELAQLKMLHQRMKAAADALGAAENEAAARARLAAFMPQLRAAEAALNAFEQKGLTLSLSSANGMRVNASRAARSGPDPLAQAEARAVRDAVATIGVREVPIYGEVVKRWHSAHTISDAQELGRQAIRDGISNQNLNEALKRGRVPGKPTARNASDVREGASMGARIAMSRAIAKGPRDAQRTIEALTESAESRGNLYLMDPAGADRLLGSADQAVSSVRGLRSAMGKSPAIVDEEIAAAKNIVEGVMVGRLGGAAIASVAAKMYGKLKVPRKVAERIIETLLDPAETEKALRFVAKRGIDPKEFAAQVVAVLNAQEKE